VNAECSGYMRDNLFKTTKLAALLQSVNLLQFLP
jgi:hypothetical protein